MALSPDRAIALAKVKEARGIERAARSPLFPQIGAGASSSREDSGVSSPDNYYDAAFDASFEIDLFGKNRNAASASDLQAQAAQAMFDDVTLTLIADVARSYVEHRYFQKQGMIAARNLESEEKTLDLIRKQNEVGEAPQLDVERAENQVNATRATLPDYKRQSQQAKLRLSVLTGLLPEFVSQIIKDGEPMPFADVTPVLASPAEVLANRPDVKAARLSFAAATKTSASETADLFPQLTLSGLFGVQDSAFVSSTSVWNVALGMAVSLIDFGRIEGRIDAAKAREEQAYHALRKSILEAVMDVEQAMVAYSHIHEQRVSLDAALQNAKKALELSQQLYQEGEVSFLDVLDAQRSVNVSDTAVLRAEFEQMISLVALYKSLGVY
jgi:NodT family efflux transporter outer membrane factor (OMF) lipoprotein